MDYKELSLKSINDYKYYTNIDLKMNKTYNFILSNKEFDEFIRFKEDYQSDDKIETSLISWNSNNWIIKTNNSF